MRTVCEIKKLAGGRYQVLLDDESSFPLYAKELAVYGIEENAEVSDQLYETIMQEVLSKRAKLKAMHLLETMDRTEQQLRTKLAALSYPEQIVEEAVAYVKKFRYVDDLRYAVNYIESRSTHKSMRQIEQELYGKGISGEILAEAREQAEKPDEESQIRAWIDRKHFDPGSADRKETERMYRFLLRKGYSHSSILHAMRADVLYE